MSEVEPSPESPAPPQSPLSAAEAAFRRRLEALPWRPHDRFFRLVFERPQEAGALLRAALPGAVATWIDWTTLRQEPPAVVAAEDLAEDARDLLFACRLATPGAEPALLLLEHLSTPRRFTALTLTAYQVGSWRRWHLASPAAGLPPAFGAVVVQGPEPWRGPGSIAELLTGPPALLALARAYTPTSSSAILELGALSYAELLARVDRPLARVALALLKAGRTDERLVDLVPRLAPDLRALGADPTGRLLLRAVGVYALCVRPDTQEELVEAIRKAASPPAAEAIQTGAQILIERGRALGREEGREEGRLEEARRMALRLIERRFPGLPTEAAVRVAAADTATIEGWLDRLHGASRIEDLLS